MLQTLTENVWTHKSVLNYAQLVGTQPDLILDLNILVSLGNKTYQLSRPTQVKLNTCSLTVISGTGAGQTRIVSNYIPGSNTIQFSQEFHPVLDSTSVIEYTTNYTYEDWTLLGIPANHIITGVKVVTLTGFEAGASEFMVPNQVALYVGNPSTMVAPFNQGTHRMSDETDTYFTSDSDLLIGNVYDMYGMGVLTIPEGSGDSYEYGSFRWFTLSTPGSATYSRNQLPGNPTNGAHCLPKRLDAHDVIARFCLLGETNNLVHPIQVNALSFADNVTAGEVEITVQYMAI
jgi:hypothetical protein